MFPYVCRDDYSMTLNEAAAYIGSVTGRRPPMATMYRWVQKGIRGGKLEAHRIGGRYFTGRQAVESFLNAAGMAVGGVSANSPKPAVPTVTTGLHARVNHLRAATHAGQVAACREEARQYLTQRLNLFKFILVC
jgi:hypothetical protein